MKFSLRELIFAVIGVGSLVGTIANNQWEAFKIERVQKDLQEAFDKKIDEKQHSIEVLGDDNEKIRKQREQILKDLRKASPAQASLYESFEACHCPQ